MISKEELAKVRRFCLEHAGSSVSCSCDFLTRLLDSHESLQKRVDDAEAVIEMYADEDSWGPSKSTTCPAITNGDVSNWSLNNTLFVGGHGAREYKKRWGIE